MTSTEQPVLEKLPPPGEPPSSHTRRWTIRIVLIALAALVAAALFWIAGDDDSSEQSLAPTTSSEPTTPPTSAPPVADATVVWPFPGDAAFPTPEAAARSFATEFLGFDDPVLEAFQQGDTRSGEVPLRPTADGPVTTVLVRQVGPGDDWSVLGAATQDIEVTDPPAGTSISSPVTVAGRALAFEGTVQVEVRQDGDLAPLGTGVVTGGGDEMRPFTGSIAFAEPTAPHGTLVFFTRSAENGQVWSAGAFRIAFSPGGVETVACGDYTPPRAGPGPGEVEVTVFFNCDASGAGEVSVFPVYRTVPESSEPLDAALTALLAGPTAAEQDAPMSSWFSSATEGMLRSVVVTDGHAVVDFEDLRSVIPGASSSAGSALLLSQLDRTVFQFATVDSVEYRIEGSCTAFTEWLQFGGCEPRTRDSGDW